MNMHNTVQGLDELMPSLLNWRHQIHSFPETAFEEFQTAKLVSQLLESFGLEVHSGIARTGVIGVLRNGAGPMIGLRADMDALHVQEVNSIPYRSTVPNKMHACGHDGHTAMLLGAASLLAKEKRFQGTLVFIFQPAEENEGGARVMIEEGFLKKFPLEAIYGLHNWPGLPAGKMAIKAGPLMAAFDTFELIIEGRGAHGAMPHFSVDPIHIAAHVILAWQSITSRNVEPGDASVVSVTQIHSGDTWNVIPQSAVLRGTTRSFNPLVRDLIESRMGEIANRVCETFGAKAQFHYERRYPSLINSHGETELAKLAAIDVVGISSVDERPVPSMTAEDFSFMLEKVPGCYVWLGNGSNEGGKNLHSPNYDFNDEILKIGVRYWVTLANLVLVNPK